MHVGIKIQCKMSRERMCSMNVLPSLILCDESFQLFILRSQGLTLLSQAVRLRDEVPCFRFSRVERRPHLGTVVLHRRNRGVHRLDGLDHFREVREETLVDLWRIIPFSHLFTIHVHLLNCMSYSVQIHYSLDKYPAKTLTKFLLILIF